MLTSILARRPRTPTLLAAWAILAAATAAAPARAAEEAVPPEVRVRAAEAHEARGELRAALPLLDAAWADLGPDAPPGTRALVQARRGRVLTELGDPDKGAPLLEEAAALAADAGLQPLRGEALNDLGNARLNDDPARALEAYGEAASIAEARGMRSLAARASLNAVRAELRRERNDAAAARLAEAERSLQAAGASAPALERLAAAGLWIELAGRDRRHLERAHRAVAAAREAAAASGDPRERSWGEGYLGELYALAGRDEEALSLHRRAALLAEAAGAPEVLFRWQWLAGRALAAQGRRDEAITAYRSAARNLDLVRLDLPAFDPRTGRSLFRETLGPVFVELADLLLQRAAAQGAEPAQVDLVEARATVERLKAVELEDYFRDDCTADLTAQARPIDRPGTRTAVLYPVLLKDRTELILSLPDGRLVSARAPMGEAAVDAEAARFRQALQNPFSRGYLGPARVLYDQLVRPVEGLLDQQQVETLVFVPDGSLRLIPLAALHDGERFLVERRAVATGLGLSLLDTRPLPARDGGVRMLVAGLSEGVQGFPALPSVREEVEAVARAMGGNAVLLTNQEFTAPAVEASLERTPFTVVHIASHGVFRGDPEDSFILTYDGRLDMNELERLIRLSRFRDEPVELLTLSACETAAGDDRSALGLAGVAVKVGARSALASLWEIADESTVNLTTRFYAGLVEPGVSRAEALRRAQLTLLADQRYRHPFFWGPFLLIGSWV